MNYPCVCILYAVEAPPRGMERETERVGERDKMIKRVECRTGRFEGRR